MVILANSSKAFVGDAEQPAISVVDLTTRQLLANIEIGIRPGALLLKPDGGELFVFGYRGTSMVILDANQDIVEQTYPTGRDPVAGVFQMDPLILYIANAGDGSVMALDVQNRTLLAAVHIGIEPRALALTPDERFLAVADTSASTLAVLRTNPTNLLTTFPVGAKPVDVVVPGWIIQ
jgi:serine/threonine-protein kinase